ncbi:MAG: hypothetical protein NZ902_02090 [Acidilobaceae archaeon]|nr:hypothetical protein [Acidilobaceae archaeon]MCX8165612.1 hypothetical protein [Acidilobaceae archaeon]MDW7974039.1 hypothetical protein [Sulfolobales archaeon]
MTFRESLDRIVDEQVKKLLADLNWVNYKLAMLRDGEEDEVERRLLMVIKSNMMKDLELLMSFRTESARQGAK